MNKSHALQESDCGTVSGCAQVKKWRKSRCGVFDVFVIIGLVVVCLKTGLVIVVFPCSIVRVAKVKLAGIWIEDCGDAKPRWLTA